MRSVKTPELAEEFEVAKSWQEGKQDLLELSEADQ
jgi:hypothetical protein